jgi:hypothetical protein
MDLKNVSLGSDLSRILSDMNTKALARPPRNEQQEMNALIKPYGSAPPLPEGSGSRVDFSA